MWNVTVSMVSPISSKPLPLFHDKAVPDIVIIANGGNWLAGRRACTHFSATRQKDEHTPLVGSDLLSSRNPTIAQDVPPALDPVILHVTAIAKRKALEDYMDTEKDRSLQLLRGVGHQIVKLEERIVSLIGQAENMRAQKGRLEYRLEKLGVSVEKLEEATKLKDPEYCRTSERVKVDEENERKQKREEDKKEKEEKKRKVISVREREDVVISVPDDEDVNENKEKEF